MYGLIIAGGSGTRLWPLSRSQHPKQLISLLGGGTSLLQDAFARLSRTIPPANILTVTSRAYAGQVLGQLRALAPELPESNILCEPSGRDSAPAVLWGALRIAHLEPGASMTVVWSDQVIREEQVFDEAITQGMGLVRDGGMLVIGVTPTRPETGLGYIKAGPPRTDGVFDVERFVEKPDLPTAERFLAEGGYSWNAGIFVFHVQTLLEEFERLAPDMIRTFRLSGNEVGGTAGRGTAVADNDWLDEALMERIYTYVRKGSIDHLVLEKTDRLWVLPCSLGWSDLGAWNVLYQESPKNADGNVLQGNVVTLDSRNNLIRGTKRLVTTIGVEDLIVVDTEDALLICRRDRDQDVKLLVDMLRQRAMREIDEAPLTIRPWGTYRVLAEAEGHKLKLIEVKPGHKLSLQLHHHRSEYWVVTEGEIMVTVDQERQRLCRGDYIHIPQGAKHRIENLIDVTAKLVELQLGDYLGEDDIVRFDDVYGRA